METFTSPSGDNVVIAQQSETPFKVRTDIPFHDKY